MEVLPYNNRSHRPSGKRLREATIVVPCYNEANRLPVSDFQSFATAQHGIRFVFVNDGSSDHTAELLVELAGSDPDTFEFLDLPRNVGKAEAIRQGVAHCLRKSPAAIGYWDADLSTRLEPISEFLHVLEQHHEIEMVIATRIGLLGRRICRKPARRFLGRIFATVASLALGMKIYDTQCGAKLFRVTPALTEAFADPFLARWIFDVELIARYQQLRRPLPDEIARNFIYEQPIDSWEDVDGSQLRSHDFATAVFDLSRIYWKYLRPGAKWTASQTIVDVASETIPFAPLVDEAQPSRRAA